MKNWDDIVVTARAEIDNWFIDQCRNGYKNFCWKYTETTIDRPGKIWIQDEEEAGEFGFYLFRLNTGKTKEQNLSDFLKIAGKLPILEYK